MTPGKTRQQAYRRRMQEGGYQQVTVWLGSASDVDTDLIKHFIINKL